MSIQMVSPELERVVALDQEIEKLQGVVARLVDWKGWSAPANDELDRVLADNKSQVKNWFRDHGLTTGYLMGASE